MNTGLARKLLKEKNLRFTNIRNEILNIFEKRNYALSYYDLEKELDSKFDMATIYRTLNTFVEHKIIHQIPLDSKISYYGLNDSDKGKKHSSNEHIHFVCKECSRTFCLNEVLVNEIKMKDKFKLHSLKIIAEGICDNCSS